MKCVRRKDNGNVLRLQNEVACEFVRFGFYEYCPKSEWKAAGRPQVGRNVSVADMRGYILGAR